MRMRPPSSSAICVTVSSSRYRSCETETTAPPNSRISRSIRSRASTSRCASGSSSSSTSGSWTRHAASATSFRSPPESSSVDRSRSSSSTRSSRSARARPSNPGPPAAVHRSTSCSWRRSTRVIRSRSSPSAPSCSETRASSRSSSWRSGRAARTDSSAGRASPSTCCGRYASRRPRRCADSPASGSSSPARIRISVDFPPPFGPITPTRARRSTSKSSPSRIVREPKLLTIPLSWSRAIFRGYSDRPACPHRRRVPRLEEELPPGRPPVVGTRDDLARLGDLDARPVAVLLDGVGSIEVDGDRRGTPRVERRDGLQVAERPPRAVLDQLPRPRSGQLPRAEARKSFLHRDRRQPLPEQRGALAARGLVARHEQDGAAPLTAERGVDPGLANLDPVEPEPPPRGARDGVREDAVSRAGHRVHRDEQRRVDALLEVVDVLRPLVLDHELAGRVELLGDQRVERPPLARAVTVHDDDLGRAGSLRPADGRVDLAGVEAAALLEHRVPAVALLPLRDPGDALHVGHDENSHGPTV